MYAIIETGGKQYRVQEGAKIQVEKLPVEAGGELTLDKVLMVGGESGVKIGAPYVEGAAVTCLVRGQIRGPKIVVFHKWRRNDSHKKTGHRQDYTTLEVKSIRA
ncbi:MAG: 50S ribosomal protein L21 [Thermodesulfobacteriota bacterium]|nr:50S ribosomal protein L21 [Desulfovibrio sp.]